MGKLGGKVLVQGSAQKGAEQLNPPGYNIEIAYTRQTEEGATKNYTIELEEYWDYNNIPEDHPFSTASSAYCIDPKEHKIYVFGGFDKEFKVSNKLSVIDTKDFTVERTINLHIDGRINHKMYFWENNIIIIGGASFDYSKPMILYNEIIIIELPEYNIKKIELEQIGLQFTGFFDYDNGIIYYTGGLNMDDSINMIDINTGEKEKIYDKNYFSRIGSASIHFEKKAIVFSGFTQKNNIPKCYSDYYIFDLETKQVLHKECNEFVGKTFSKAVLIEKHTVILFVFGSNNGIDISRSITSYNYKQDYFTNLYMQEIPVSINEGLIFYLKDKNKLYITGGISHNRIQSKIWALDIDAIIKMQNEADHSFT